MKIAILGTGNVGKALGEGFSKAGHDVVYGSRTPAKAGLAAPVLSLADAATTSEVVVSALPGGAALDILRELGTDVLAGKVLVDVDNAITAGFELLYPNGSLGAEIQDALPETFVVKTLNTISASVMAAPGALPAPTTVFLSGNDAKAKATVSSLLTDLGWSKAAQLDLGDIASARGPEHYFFLSVGIMTAVGTTDYGIAVVS